jgi:cardiolipin synthase A/B
VSAQPFDALPARPARRFRFGRRAPAALPWYGGNKLELLENGEQYFPAVFAAIGKAERTVMVETFILFEDSVGNALRDVLIAAAQRGVHVDLTYDHFGSPDLSREFVDGLTAAGVVVRMFDPARKLFGLRPNVFRRLHRKLVVVDDAVAFVGGINFSEDHYADSGRPDAKHDFAVRIEGPLVEPIRSFMRTAIATRGTGEPWKLPPPPTAAVTGGADAMFVVRDNGPHANDIERHYKAAIRTAQREIIIANAYFFPGHGLLRQLRNAARRGVKVRIMVQGNPDVPLALAGARWLYRYLTKGGVEIHEFCARPFHGKVAIIDDDWATIGSSNLDPLSLSVNLEANIVVRDKAFNAALREKLGCLLDGDCKAVDCASVPPRTWWRTLCSGLIFHFLRRFPRWAGLLPAHTPAMKVVKAKAET